MTAGGGHVDSGPLTVRRISYWQPVSVIGTDEHGRPLIICPHCHDDAYIAEDGRVVCPLGEATNRLLEAGLADLGLINEAPPALRRSG
jgi:hypothetical protein